MKAVPRMGGVEGVMRRGAVPVLVLLALLGGRASGQEGPASPPGKPPEAAAPAPPKPMTEDEAVAAVLDAWKAKDDARLKDLAAKDEPDPWIVADELCARNEHDAAAAFAKAAPRPDTEALPGFVESRGGKGNDSAAREALRAMNRALGTNDFSGALAAVEKAVLDDGTSRVVVVRLLHGRGLALRGQGQLEESTTAFREAGQTASLAGWLRWAASALDASGVSANARFDRNAACDAWTKRLEIEERRGNRAGMAATLGNIGLIHASLGDYPKALSYQERALQMKEESGDHAGVATTLGNIGNMYVRRGEFPKALSYQERALRVKEELGDRAGVAAILGNIGSVHGSLGDYPKALSYRERALRMNEESGDRAGMATDLEGIGVLHCGLGNYTKALSCEERALKLKEEAGDRAGVAGILGIIGSIHQSLGAYAKALSFQERALTIMEELKDRAGVAMTLGNIGNVHCSLGAYGKAISYQERALQMKAEVGDLAGVVATYGNLGAVYILVRDYPKALSYLERTLELREELGDRAGLATTLANIGKIHYFLGDYPMALAYQERAQKLSEGLGDRAGVAAGLGDIGTIHDALGDHAKALSFEEQSLALLEELGDGGGVAMTLGNIGIIRNSLGDYPGAMARAREAVERIALLTRGLSEEQQALGRRRFGSAFTTGALAAARIPSPADLCYFLESGRAGALRESLEAREALQGAVLPPQLLEIERAARGREVAAAAALRRALGSGDAAAVKEARASLDAARDEVGEVVGRIQREAKAAATVMYGAVDDLPAIQGRVGPGEALLLYGVFPGEDSLALVVTAKEARIVSLGKTEPVEKAVAALRPEEEATDPADAVRALKALVVAPLALGEDIQRVLVSPDGALSYVPFSLLMPGIEIAHVPSGTVYGLLMEEKTKKGEGVLALGDPQYQERNRPTVVASLRSGWELASLPATKEEAKAIGSTVLLGKEATEEGLKTAIAGRPRWHAVHLACHGLIDPERPMLSALAVTPSEAEDGFLSVLDVFRMKVPADLVVLSACETGKGKVIRGEGIIGLTRGFMFAGAPRVLVSLWKVDDAATKALMVKFYELWDSGRGVAPALKEAQAFVAGHEKWKHPKYWAAWVLWGLPE